MVHEFETLVGKFMHNCGVLEFFTNNAIRYFGTDTLLSSHTARSSWRERLRLLRSLLTERSELKSEDTKSLCDSLEKIAKRRNAVAHNPVATPCDHTSAPCILVLRYASEAVSAPEKIGKSTLEELINRANEIARRFEALAPECSKT